MNATFHPYAWTLWFLAVVTTALMTRNPLYQGVLALALTLNLWALRRPSQAWQGWRWVLRLALWLAGFSVAVNVLTVHHGRHVLLVLPRTWPVIGGPLTLEALLFGLATALSLLTLLLAFAVYNLEMTPARWLRLTPGFLHTAGVITAIAVAFVPGTWQAARDIYDAQRLRGHRFRRLTDYTPLLAPLLVDSLERSVQLAASMAARGFGAGVRPLPAWGRVILQGMLIAGLLALALGAFGRAYGLNAWGTPLLVTGAAILLGVFYAQQRRVLRRAYRRWLWRPRDVLLALGSGLLLVIALGLRWRAPEVWLYYPYPPYAPWPDFRWVPGVFLLVAALPAWLAPTPPVQSSRELSP